MAHAMMIRVQSRHTPPPSGCPRGEMFGPLVNPCERTSGNRQTAPDGRSRSAGPVGSCRPSYVGFNPPRVRLASGARRDSVRWTSVVGARPDGGVPPSEGPFKRGFVELNSCDMKILYNPTRTPPTPRATCRRLTVCLLSIPQGPCLRVRTSPQCGRLSQVTPWPCTPTCGGKGQLSGTRPGQFHSSSGPVPGHVFRAGKPAGPGSYPISTVQPLCTVRGLR